MKPWLSSLLRRLLLTLATAAGVIALFRARPPVRAEELNMKIQGNAGEQAPLEELKKDPSVPGADQLEFSLDGGKSALESEVVPLTPARAALMADESHLPAPVMPVIPSAPFIVQPLPLPGDPTSLGPFAFSLKKPLVPDHWAWIVTDEYNDKVYETGGPGLPPSPLTWDGANSTGFALNPNRTYASFLVYYDTSGPIGTVPGESSRFLALAHAEGNDQIIEFSDRVYRKDEAAFSDESTIYLRDVVWRLSRLYPPGIGKVEKADAADAAASPNRDKRAGKKALLTDVSSGAVVGQWSLILYESNPGDAGQHLAERRKALWKNYVSKALGKTVPDDNITIIRNPGGDTTVRFVLEGYLGYIEPNIQGYVSAIRPAQEDLRSWMHIHTDGGVLFIEFRHDRLFRPGSAILNDDALPLLAQAINAIHQQEKDWSQGAPGEEGKKKKKAKGPTGPVVVLRSYTEKYRDEKRDRMEEDPKLAALRSKVLFTILAREKFPLAADVK